MPPALRDPKKEPRVNIWSFYLSQKQIQRAALGWKARSFYALFKSEGSHSLRIEDLDVTGGYARLSISGPTLEFDAEPARVTFEWTKGDESCKRAEKGEIMSALANNYRTETTDRKQKVMAAGRDIVGYQVYI